MSRGRLGYNVARFCKNQRGNVAMMTALFLLIVVGAGALAIDVSKGTNNKSRLADASDAVSLMLAKSEVTDPVLLRRMATEFLAQNYPSPKDEFLEIIEITRDGDAVTVKLADLSKNAFDGVWQKKGIRTSVASTSVFERRNMDIALVLDSTGSMRGSKMTTLKSAASDMIDTIDQNSRGNVKMSVVPFATYVNVGSSQAGMSWLDPFGGSGQGNPWVGWNGCVGSRLSPNDMRPSSSGGRIPALAPSQGSCGTAILPMTRDFRTVKARINSLVATGATYIPSGLIWGWRTLDNGQPFPNGSNPDVDRVIVLMTDGMNTRSKSGLFHNGGSIGNANTATRSLCRAIKDEDIIIYSIAYEVSDATTRNLLEDCATERANYFNARNASDLSDAFGAIAASLIDLRIKA